MGSIPRPIPAGICNSNEKADQAQDWLIKIGHCGIIDGGNYKERYNALYVTSDDPAE